MTVFSAILHDSYPDENGIETPYEDKIIAVQNEKEFDFDCVSIPDFMQFVLLNEEFFKKCTDIKVVFE
jgi:hypothetical protein